MKDIRFYFDKAAKTYESAGILQKKVADYLLSMIPSNYYPTVLEIGSGRGFLTMDLIEKISYKRYINIDISFELIKRLRKSLGEKCLYINCRAESIPLKEGSVDLLISSSSLHWLEDAETNLQNILKLLKINGSFYFSIFLEQTLNELKEVSRKTGFGSFYPLKSALFYLKIFNSIPEFKWSYSIKKYTEYFPTVRDLLISHKLTGTNYTKNKKFSGKDSFFRFCETYKNLYGNHRGVRATYEVLFIRGQRVSPSHKYQSLIP